MSARPSYYDHVRACYEPVRHASIMAQLDQDQLERAEALCTQVIDSQPTDSEAIFLQSLLRLASADVTGALYALEKAIELSPNNPMLRMAIGEIYLGQRMPQEANRCFQQACQLAPDVPWFRYRLGMACLTGDKLREAIEAFRHCVRLAPRFAEAQAELAKSLYQIGDWDTAFSTCETVLDSQPAHPWASNMQGIIRLRQGRPQDAIILLASAHQTHPDRSEILANLGEAYVAVFELGRAVECFQKALAIAPAAASTLNNLARVLVLQGRIEQAMDCYQQAIQLEPAVASRYSGLIFAHKYRHDQVNDSEREACHAWNQAFATKRAPATPVHRASHNLRVGFVSQGLRWHPVGIMLIRAFEALVNMPIETYCYYDHPSEDALTNRFSAAANGWRIIAGAAHRAVLDQIQQDKIDVLIDLDGHTSGNRLTLFAEAEVPVRLTWLGNVGPLGVSVVDYCLADPWLIPPSQNSSDEEPFVPLAHCWATFDGPRQAPINPSLPLHQAGIVTLASFNNPAKLSPAAINRWSEILRQVPNSRLLIKYAGLDDAGTTNLFREQFLHQGISPERIRFEGWSSFESMLDLYSNEVDIALDTFPFNGGLTTLLALWMGVPVISFPGNRVHGRQSYSILNTMGVLDSLATDEDGYVTKAVELANNPVQLQLMRRSLRTAMERSPLCDGAIGAHDLVTAINHCLTLPRRRNE